MSRAAVESHTCPLLLQGVRVIHNFASALSLEKVGGCYTKGLSLLPTLGLHEGSKEGLTMA
jgi:hypothetical protein